MDYSVYQHVTTFASHHTWLAHAVNDFENVGVVVYAALVVVVWLLARPGVDRRWKFAALSATVAALFALLLNQVIAKVWHRPRPYETHPGAYHLSSSHDPSFPSDHASAAFAIAFAIFFVDRRIGRFFLAGAILIGAGRVFIGAHYPGDVLAGVVVGAAAAAIVVWTARPLIFRAILILERISDPVVRAVRARLARRETARQSA